MKRFTYAISATLLAIAFTACQPEKTGLEDSIQKCWKVSYEQDSTQITAYYWGTEKEVKNVYAYLQMDDIEPTYTEITNTDEIACAQLE